ncbi:MAG: hypothetical protein ABIV50_06335, partial [Opitutus sp.]
MALFGETYRDFYSSLRAMIRLCPLRILVSSLLVLLLAGCARKAAEASVARVAMPDRVDFNRHIRPIFNQNCTACHGGVKMAAGI